MQKEDSTAELLPHVNLTPMPPEEHVTTTLDHLFSVASTQKYGRGITQVKTAAVETRLDSFLDHVNIRVVHTGERPREIRQITVDVNTKEYFNYGSENDTTAINIAKSTGGVKASSFEFFTASGLICGTTASLGAKVLSLGLSGGEWNRGEALSTEDVKYLPAKTTLTHAFCFDYGHEEKITIPAGKKVKAVITTFAVKYELDYVLEFCVPKSWCIPFRFLTPCQKCFCRICGSSSGTVYASELLHSLPNYHDDQQWVYFTQKGNLTWINESSKVEKFEQNL